jgi:S1-C subfamily serine protease
MCRRACLGSIAFVLLVTAAGQCDDDLTAARNLESAMQRAIAKVEPAVACILVSRSTEYKQFDGISGTREPGQLGGFDRPDPDMGFRRGPARLFDQRRREVAERLDLSAPNHVPESFGSGVVIDTSGKVLTCYHVVRDAAKIFVRLQGQKGSYADILAADERSDLAVLKMITPPPGLVALPLGNGNDTRKGQMVLSVSNPFAAGFRDGSPSSSWGIISNVRRRVPGEYDELQRRRKLHYYGTLLQTDARMGLGCSGGALIDLNGNLIGIISSHAALTGGETAGGFAMPMDAIYRRVIETLRRGEEVEYGFLGVSFPLRGSDLTYEVMHNSPAQKAGMQSRERIMAIDGVAIKEPDDLFLAISARAPGSMVRITVGNGFGLQRVVTPRLVKYYVPRERPLIAANRPAPIRGLRVDYSSILVRPDGGPRDSIPPGVVVREVMPNSPAERAALQPNNDLIIEVNGQRVETPQEFADAAQKTNGPLELTIHDLPEPRKVTLR